MTAGEIAPRFALLGIVCTGSAVYSFVQAGGSDPFATVFATLFRPFAWLGLAVGVVALVIAAIAWRRALHQSAAYARTGLTRKDLRALSPDQFEEWCAARLREQGYRVKEVGGQGDHGIDLVAEKDTERLVVQCKRWFGVRLIGEPQVRDLFGAMHHEQANGAMVITTGLFSEPALAWARDKPIRLWDVERLMGGTPVVAIRPTVLTARPTRACGKCSSGNLVRRVNRKNQQPFFGCSRFPTCRYTEPI